MIIYLDSDFICHLSNDGTMQEVETDVFDGKADEYIKGYRYVPQGQTWTRSDGVQFQGMMISPAVDYKQIMTNVAVSYLDDDQAESVTILFPNWEVGVLYSVGDRRQYDGLLYRCVQAHTSQADWTPPIVPALWVRTFVDIPVWTQPTGSADAYNIGDKVHYPTKEDSIYVSLIDGNVWSPEAYPAGWEEVV